MGGRESLVMMIICTLVTMGTSETIKPEDGSNKQSGWSFGSLKSLASVTLKSAGIGAIGAGMVKFVPTVLGLSSAGPVAGGTFATLQAAGWVTPGSILAATQSAAMTGAFAVAGPITLVGGGIFAGSYLLYSSYSSCSKEKPCSNK